MKAVKIRDVTTIALFAAVICVLSQLVLPSAISAVPLTLQTFAIMLAGFCLPPTKAVSAAVTYIALGAVGLPVFSGFQGGFGVLLGPTGGFIWGFVFLAWFCSLSKKFKHIASRIGITLSGLFICHIFGALQYCAVMSTSFLSAVLVASLPYTLKDAALGAAAYFISLKVK